MTPRKREGGSKLCGCVVALVVATLPAGAPDAVACGNAVHPVVIKRIRDVASAADALGDGKPRLAALTALGAYPALHTHDGLLGDAPTWDAMGVRAQRTVAVAVVRTEGLLVAGEDFHATTIDERRASLRWSIGILRAVVNLTGAPDAQTDLGEALSKLPETRSEAWSILERLDQQDLVTSAQAYAALADLREDAGDLRGRDQARRRFAAMKKTPETAAPPERTRRAARAGG